MGAGAGREESMRGLDAWLTRDPRDVPFPTGVEDTLGTIILWPEGMDEDTLVPEFGEVTNYEEEEPDAEYDDEGIPCYSGGGVRYEVTNLHHEGRTEWVREGDLEQYTVPSEYDHILEARAKALSLQQQAQGAMNVYENRRRQIGFEAVNARRDREYAERKQS